MRPALTAEEWARWEAGQSVFRGDDSARDPGYESWAWEATLEQGALLIRDAGADFPSGTPPHCRHALAALALRGQPFGFTWDDVDDERECYRLAVVAATHAQQVGDEAERLRLKALAARCHARADRIAALLPPREG